MPDTLAFTWQISSLEVAPSDNGLLDVIKVAHWRYRATASDDGLTAEVYGAQGFPAPEPASYTPFESVTEADVVGWIEGLIGTDGVEAMNAGLGVQIENLRNPPVETRSPPWAA